MPETITIVKTARRGSFPKDLINPTKEFGTYLHGSGEGFKIFQSGNQYGSISHFERSDCCGKNVSGEAKNGGRYDPVTRWKMRISLRKAVTISMEVAKMTEGRWSHVMWGTGLPDENTVASTFHSWAFGVGGGAQRFRSLTQGMQKP